MRENEAIVRVYPRHVSERERPMTLMLLPDLPKGVRPLVTPIVDTADAAFVMSLDCQFLAWGLLRCTWSPIGTFETSHDVRSLVAIGGNPDMPTLPSSAVAQSPRYNEAQTAF
jgi:hypothetical protein